MTERLGDEFRNYIISEGTCRREDVFNAICRFVSNNEIGDETVTDLIDEYNNTEECGSIDLDDREIDLQDIYDDLWDALNNIAPEGCVFGAHEGDGALIGFWDAEYNEEEWI